MAGKRVLVVGAGAIGTALADRLAPFGVDLTMVARGARPGVEPAERPPDLRWWATSYGATRPARRWSTW